MTIMIMPTATIITVMGIITITITTTMTTSMMRSTRTGDRV